MRLSYICFTFADNLIYRAGSDRIPFGGGQKKPSKYEHPYDIPRDHHNRALYDIPKNTPASVSSSINYEIVSRSDTVTSAPSSDYLQSLPPKRKKPPMPTPYGNSYRKPTANGHSVEPEALQETAIVDDTEYIYMENTSETTAGVEELGGNHDKTSREVMCYRGTSCMWVCVYVGGPYGKLWFAK